MVGASSEEARHGDGVRLERKLRAAAGRERAGARLGQGARGGGGVGAPRCSSCRCSLAAAAAEPPQHILSFTIFLPCHAAIQRVISGGKGCIVLTEMCERHVMAGG